MSLSCRPLLLFTINLDNITRILFRLLENGDAFDFSCLLLTTLPSVTSSDWTSFKLEKEQHPLECEDSFRLVTESLFSISSWSEASCVMECSSLGWFSLSFVQELFSFSLSTITSFGGKTFSWKIPGMFPYDYAKIWLITV